MAPLGERVFRVRWLKSEDPGLYRNQASKELLSIDLERYLRKRIRTEWPCPITCSRSCVHLHSKKHTVSGLLQFLALSQSFTYGLEMVGATSKTIATHLAAWDTWRRDTVWRHCLLSLGNLHSWNSFRKYPDLLDIQALQAGALLLCFTTAMW